MNHKIRLIQRRECQTGVTLMSLMAGLLVSTLSVLASISAYLNLRAVASDAESVLVHDGQIVATLLVAEKYVMDAGYGITDAGPNDIKIVSTSATLITDATTSLLWRYNDGSSIVCTGLKESGVLIDEKQYRLLTSIGSSADCNEISDLGTLLWADEATQLGQWPVTDDVANYLTTNETLIDFQMSTLICSPFGYGASASHLSVTISIPSTAELSGAITQNGSQTTLCLSNISPT